MEFLSRFVVALTRVGHKVIGLQSPEELERQVATRTAELARANDALRAEVEQRLRVEQTLLKEQERFRLTLASIGDGVLATDALGRVNFLNGVACSLTGWSAEDAEGKPVEEVFRVVQEGSRRPVESPAARALREGTAVALSNSTVLIARDGTERPIDNCGAPIRDAGRLAGAVLVFRDVGERRRANEAHARLAAIVESSEDAIIGKSLNGTITSWNNGAARLFGYAAVEALGRPISILAPPDRPDEMKGILDRIRLGERIEAFETIRVRKDGSRVDVSLSVSPMKDSEGNVVGAAKIVRGITRQKKTEEALRRQDEQLRLQAELLNLSHAMVREADGRIITWTDGMARLYGWTREQAEGRLSHELLQTRFPRPLEEINAQLLRDGRWEGELTHVRPDGAEVTVASFWVVHRDAAGKVCVLEVNNDMTAQKKAEGELRRTAGLLQAISDETTDAVFVKDERGRYLLFNESASRFVGKPVTEVLGRDDAELFDPEGARLVMARDRRVMETGQAETEEEVLTAAGVTRTYLSMKAPYRDAQGKIAGTIGVSRDISDRKKAEVAVQENETRYRFLFERNLAGVIVTRADGAILGANEAAVRIFGLGSRDELLRRRMPEFYFDPAERTALTEAAAQDLSTTTREVRFRRADGQPVWVLANVSIADDGPDGRVYLTTLFDVTDHKRAEAERDALLGRLRLQIERMPLAYIMFDAEMHIADWNPAAEKVFGFSAEEALGRGTDLIVSPEFIAAEGGERLRRLRTGDMAVNGVNANRTKDGRTIICQWFNTPLMDEARRLTSVLSLAQDVTARIESEDALRLRDRAIRAVTQGILITDPSRPDNPIIYASPGFERLTGYTAEEAVGRNCRFLQGPQTDPAAAAQLREAVAEARACSVELLNYRKDGTPFWNAHSISPVHNGGGRPTHFVAVLTDVTEKRRLEEQFRQAQKMEAVGQLAGGVAHDFNNVLQVINGYGEILLESPTLDEPARDMVGQMLEAGNRAAGLTRQLLTFSRQQILAPTVLDLNAVVADLEKMLRRVIGEDIDLKTVLRPGVGRVKADPGQVEQVVLNLAVNARDAMPSGGKLTVETQNVELDEEYARLRVGVRTGPHVLLAVSDTGSGMTPEVQARIFEPFFTTKEKDKGTGLGLSTVFGIVNQAGGHVAVYSELGVGTSIKVYLPRVDEEASPAESRPERGTASGGAETVLLVEDEDAVRALTRIVLEGQGYCVLEASDGAEAHAIADRHEGPIHLLLSDVVMPVMGGRQLAERLLASHPELKVLFQSGYTDDAVVRHGILHEKVHFLQKPYSPAALASKVREVLDLSG